MFYNKNINTFTELGVVALPVIPALESWRQEDYEFEAILGHKARPYFKCMISRINEDYKWSC